MGLIKTLKKLLSNEPIYPITKTNAVYDDTMGRLDQLLKNSVVEEDMFEESPEVPRDADTLGGRQASYFATQLDIENAMIGNDVEEYEGVEPRDADTLGGHSPEYYAKQSNVTVLNNDFEQLKKAKASDWVTLPITLNATLGGTETTPPKFCYNDKLGLFFILGGVKYGKSVTFGTATVLGVINDLPKKFVTNIGTIPIVNYYSSNTVNEIKYCGGVSFRDNGEIYTRGSGVTGYQIEFSGVLVPYFSTMY